MVLSIVTTMYYSEKYLEEFYRRVSAAAQEVTGEYEIVFVNDGSPDDSLTTALKIRARDAKVKVVDLSKNFGHHKAVMAGLTYAKGEYVFLLDCDLEENPEILNEFWGMMSDEADLDVVYGVQEVRKGGLFEKMSGKFFYKMFNAISDVKIPENVLMVRLMKRAYVQELLRINEFNIFLGGVFEYIGFTQKAVVIKKGDKGETTYSLKRKIKMMVDSVTSFSSFPLVISFYLGLIISFLSFAEVFWLIFRKLVLGIHPEMGWTSLMVSIWFLGGVILMAIGVIGVYLSRIYLEVKGRPNAIVKKVHE